MTNTWHKHRQACKFCAFDYRYLLKHQTIRVRRSDSRAVPVQHADAPLQRHRDRHLALRHRVHRRRRERERLSPQKLPTRARAKRGRERVAVWRVRVALCLREEVCNRLHKSLSSPLPNSAWGAARRASSPGVSSVPPQRHGAYVALGHTENLLPSTEPLIPSTGRNQRGVVIYVMCLYVMCLPSVSHYLLPKKMLELRRQACVSPSQTNLAMRIVRYSSLFISHHMGGMFHIMRVRNTVGLKGS